MNSPESARESIRVCEHFLGDDYAAVPWLCLTIGRGWCRFLGLLWAFRCLWWVVWVWGDAGRVGWRHGCLSPVHRRASVAVTLEGGVRGLP